MATTPKKTTAPKAAPAVEPAEAVTPKAAKKPVAAKAVKVEAAPVKVAPKTVTIRQTGSPLRRPAHQRATLQGLGLNKMGRERVLEDTPSIRGAIAKVAHMVTVIEPK